MSAVAVLAVWALLVAGGRGLLRWAPQPEGALSRLLVWTLAGLFGLHTVLTILNLMGWPWSRGTLSLVGVGVLALNLMRSSPTVRSRRQSSSPYVSNHEGSVPGVSASGFRWSWGVILATVGSLTLAWVAASLWSTNPDFVYHWGIKGHRFFLAEGVDEAFLLKSWNRLSHPDYPFLQPQLFAVAALLRGFFDESAMLLQTALWSLLAAVAARQAMASTGASRFSIESTTAVVGLALAMFAVAHRLSGGPDVMIAWVLVAAAGPLLASASDPEGAGGRRGSMTAWDLQLALAMAVGAAAKVEGVPLAAVALTVYALRQRLWRRPWPIGRLLLLAAPSVVAVVPWWVYIHRLGLFGRLNAGPIEWEHWRVIAPELVQSLLHPHWHGLPVLVVLTLPLVFLDRRVRPLVLVALAQLFLYVYVYFTALESPEVHVRTSFTRVLCHVVPALLVAACLAFDGWVRRRAQKAPISARPQTLP